MSNARELSKLVVAGEVQAGAMDTYATIAELPLTGVDTGTQAYVAENNRLYIFTGTGWFNIALVNTAPTITSGGAGAYTLATDGTPTVITLVAEDPEGIPITWSYAVTSGSLGSTATVVQADNVFTITPSTNAADQGSFVITFTASDGVNIATDVNSFFLAFLSPLWDETVLSVGTSSTNSLANSTVIDRSTNAHPVTSNGTPVQTAFHPYLDNWSNQFDGSGDWNTVTLDAFSTAFTVEMWLMFNSTPGSGVGLLDGQSSGLLNMYWDGGSYGTNVLTISNRSSNQAQFSWVPNTGQWYHLALVRESNNTMTAYVDGISIGSVANGTSYGGGTYTIGGDAGNNWSLNGYISNFRIVNGEALYTSAFAPPTEKLTAVSGTSLLTCQSNRFIDNSSSARAINPTGNTKISAFNPFGQLSEYNPNNQLGSIWFGDTDNDNSIQVTDGTVTDFGTDDFTIEFWFYPSGTIPTTTYTIVNGFNNPGASGTAEFYIQTSGQNKRLTWNAFTHIWTTVAYSNTDWKPYEWTHAAFVRNGTSCKIYQNGIEVASATVASNQSFNNDYSNTRIGCNQANTSEFRGYLADFRITKSTAVYTSAFTPPIDKVGAGSSTVYLPMDNAGVFDKTGNNTLDLYGNASTSTTETKYATTSIGLDGSGDYIFLPNSSTAIQSLPQGSSWTIDFWGYITTSSSHILGINGASTGANAYLIYGTGVNLDGAVSSNTIPLNQWVHHAIVYEASSGDLTYYRDGTQIYQRAGRTTLSYPISNCVIGFGTEFDAPNGGSPGNYTNGYIEDISIVAAAKYTTNFTPPTQTQGRIYQAES